MKWLIRGQIALGLWLVAAPWILGFSGVTSALWSSIIGGALVFILALWIQFGEE
ncbi:MAG: hypothetical protein COU08_02545 [Candidatus Harrisonbacteria bacterium CG10_big_fil_rev_8_21_14_0_10_42_17]|uniref:SPW repeat-containing integral membrane domain-containing protein n=1 Tax=Candidatus Harrisonbacteria bacterium CG10_big_fil_rev_8_21_14_0_10_42_17 TaxID=1974584 RepID=A0A2M6WHZ3_9BACT|nr:MAG: hypothetical protein COU08_02545 [Candidatus Harrisonbacteria bacterium CG10_big_fil_rev_8_21_14_0_10_42_17]